MQLQLLKFEADTYIELDDVITGRRKMALVLAGGDMYIDDVSSTSTPFPVYQALKPVALGTPMAWGLEVASTHPHLASNYSATHRRLTEAADVDTLTRGRALYWAYMHRVYDYDRALAAGRAATQAVREGRARMDALLVKAGAVQ